jgi:RNA recognition motif-containing protein
MARNINFTGDIDDLDANLFELDKLQRPATSGGDGASPNRPQTRQKVQKGTRAYKKRDADDENLGEDFEDSPWVPPSVEKATMFKRERIFRNGDARLDSVDIIHAPDVGVGVTLYFQFAMSMTICLLIMSALSLPSLIFVYNGNGIAPEDQDAIGLYKYTLGNMGYDISASNYRNLTKCTGSGYAAGETCLQINGNEVSMSDAANVITAMEFLQIFVFFIGVFHLYRKALSVTGKNSKADASVSDYSVMITGIPADTTEEELITHFNNLYKLDEKDYKNRPPLEGAEPVSDIGNTGDSRFNGLWIAECILHKGIGDFVSTFKNKQHIMERMYRCRARMKMYAENSPHADGHNMHLYLKAEQQMMHTGVLIDKLAENNMRKSGLKIISENDSKEALKVKRIGNRNSIYYNIDADSVAAFICFQYGESTARCIDDYTKYSTFPMSLFYPHELKFRGHKIHVEKAPEPDQIVWEHIEVGYWEKTWLRGRTALVTVVLVIFCFIIILQASIYKSLLSKNTPQLALCNDVIPSIYTNRSTERFPVNLVRPKQNQVALDLQCSSKYPKTFYAYYVHKGKNNTNYAAHYNISVCDSTLPSGHGLCPKLNYKQFCPCVSIEDKQECTGCYYNTKKHKQVCEPFKAGNIGACYCYSQLLDLLKSGVTNTLNSINKLQHGECAAFYSQYSLSSALSYISVVATTIVNVVMRIFLKRLANHEARTSLDEYQGSIMSKIFLSNFATMAIIVLVAYGNAKSNNSFLQGLHIFTGPYADFTRSWYGNVGFYLMTTFILQSFSPLVFNLFLYFIGNPLLRLYHHMRIR